jgi:hypothetical protein
MCIFLYRRSVVIFRSLKGPLIDCWVFLMEVPTPPHTHTEDWTQGLLGLLSSLLLPLNYIPSFFFFFFLFFETGSPFVVQAGLKLEVLLPQPPKSWDYRHAQPCPNKNKFLKPQNCRFWACGSWLMNLAVLSKYFSSTCFALSTTQAQNHRHEIPSKKSAGSSSIKGHASGTPWLLPTLSTHCSLFLEFFSSLSS